jgi:hypothetical protein
MDEPPKPFSSSVANPKERESNREIEGQREKEKREKRGRETKKEEERVRARIPPCWLEGGVYLYRGRRRMRGIQGLS